MRTIRLLILLLFLLAITVAFFHVVKTLLLPALTAAIFASLFHPLYRRINSALGKRESTAAALTCIIFLCVLVIPSVSILGMVASQLIQWVTSIVENYDQVEEAVRKGYDYVSSLPLSGRFDPANLGLEEKLGELLQSTATFVTEGVTGLSMSAFQLTFTLFILLFSMFYFFKDGPAFIDRLKYLSPLDDSYEDRLLSRFVSTARATIKGTFLLGLVQGGLGMITFLIFSVEGALFWGVIIMFFSLIPAVGTGFVWVPAGVFKLITGHYVQGAGILLTGVIVIGNVDNLLRPRLLGKDTEIHPLLILLSTLGGIVAFGILGIILGPVIAALFITIWSIYGEEFKSELDRASGAAGNETSQTGAVPARSEPESGPPGMAENPGNPVASPPSKPGEPSASSLPQPDKPPSRGS